MKKRGKWPNKKTRKWENDCENEIWENEKMRLLEQKRRWTWENDRIRLWEKKMRT